MWKPTTITEVEQIVQEDLQHCSTEEAAFFERFRVIPYRAPLTRSEHEETVVVVARRDKEVMYWEDVEEGFNISPVDEEGRILEPGGDQDELPLAIRRWMSS